MKKIIISLATVAVVSAVAVGATRAYFSSTATSTGNTFTTATMDLEVNGGSTMLPYVVANLVPGESRGTETYSIKNTSSVPGVLSFKVKNVTTNENDIVSPETAAGDGPGVRLDPDNYTIAASGEGELLDQVMLTFWVDDTPGQRPSPSDWQDTKYWVGYPDQSSYYRLPVDTDLMSGKNIVLQPGQTLYMGIGVKFISDTDTPYQWILQGVSNNAAMSDDFKFDIELSLVQTH